MDTTMDNAVATTVRADLAPTTEEVALLTRQYQKALDGLYEAYRFGMMLRAVKERLDAADGAGACAAPTPPAEVRSVSEGDMSTAQGASPRPAPVGAGLEDAGMGDGHDAETGGLPGSLTRETARCEQPHGGALAAPGWNRGMGLKGWLAIHCPEINYKTACRFLAVAEKTVAALALSGEGESGERQSENGLPDAPDGADRSPLTVYRSPDPDKVREFLAGRSQRSILRLGGARPGAGRKAKDWAAALEASPEIAWKELAEPLERLSRLIVRERRHAVLTPTDLHTLRDAIDLLHEVIHADA